MSPLVGAVDWGGTWIRAAVVDGDRIVARARRSRPESLAEQHDTVAALLRDCATAAGATPVAVGVGIAGIVQGGGVATAVNLGIRSWTPVERSLRSLLDRPVFLVNDTQAAAAGLRWPTGVTAVVSMGTGLGGAVLDEGRLVTGRGAAGDIGHSIVVADGLACPCGGRGCLEEYASGRALAAVALSLSGRSPLLAERLRSAGTVHAGDLQDAARAGEPDAVAAVDRAARYLAIGFRNVVAHLDPQRIALAGAILAPDTLFGAALRRHWESLRPSWNAAELAHVRDDSDTALRGAAAVALQRLHIDPRPVR